MDKLSKLKLHLTQRSSLVVHYREADVKPLISFYDSKIAELQAKIDSLMLEHCPEEMTAEQTINWEKNQKEHIDEQTKKNH